MSESIEYLRTLGSPEKVAEVLEQYAEIKLHPNTIRYWKTLKPEMAGSIRKAFTLYYEDMIMKVSLLQGDANESRN